MKTTNETKYIIRCLISALNHASLYDEAHSLTWSTNLAAEKDLLIAYLKVALLHATELPTSL